MLPQLLTRLFGSRNERLLRQLRKTVQTINALEPKYEAMDDATVRGQTDVLKARLAAGETLDDILPDAFAAVREGSKRALKMRHLDVQLIGGVVLHSGKIAEMRTGGHVAGVSECPLRQGRARGDGERLPRAP